MKAKSNNSANLRALTKVMEQHLGTKFCTNCQLRKPIDGGKTVPNKHTARWYCAECYNRRKLRQTGKPVK